MAIANKLGKKFFRLLKKNFPSSSNLYKISNKNIKLSYSLLPDVGNLINKSNTKKLRNKQCIETPKCNCINKDTCPLKGKCQYECIVYEMEVYSCKPNNGNVSCNDKKVYVGSSQGPFKKIYYNHRSSFMHEIYTYRTSLSV